MRFLILRVKLQVGNLEVYRRRHQKRELEWRDWMERSQQHVEQHCRRPRNAGAVEGCWAQRPPATRVNLTDLHRSAAVATLTSCSSPSSSSFPSSSDAYSGKCTPGVPLGSGAAANEPPKKSGDAAALGPDSSAMANSDKVGSTKRSL